MHKTIGVAALMLALVADVSATPGGTALATSGPGDISSTAQCMYTVYFWGFKWVIPAPCPAGSTDGGTANSSGSAAGTSGSST